MLYRIHGRNLEGAINRRGDSMRIAAVWRTSFRIKEEDCLLLFVSWSGLPFWWSRPSATALISKGFMAYLFRDRKRLPSPLRWSTMGVVCRRRRCRILSRPRARSDTKAQRTDTRPSNFSACGPVALDTFFLYTRSSCSRVEAFSSRKSWTFHRRSARAPHPASAARCNQ